MPALSSDLTGPYQSMNIRTTLEALWCWNAYYPDEHISDDAIVKGMASVKKSTGMIGRWLTLQRDPMVIADAAHNLDGMKAMLPGLLKLEAQERHFVLGFVADKDIGKLLALFPKKGRYYWCAPDLPRAKDPKETKEAGHHLGLHGVAFNRVWEAFQSALSNSNRGDLIFIGGSSYVVGDFLADYQVQTK
jgi:dihydrofolate synthase/folylpolyglutamate synthase